MMEARYSSPEAQAWLRFWVSHHGPNSYLAPYIRETEPQPVHEITYLNGRISAGFSQIQARIAPNLVIMGPSKRQRWDEPWKDNHPRKPTIKPPRKPRTVSPKVRAERRLERDVERTKKLPQAEWAKRIQGDPRISWITLEDILDSIEDYFEIFDGMRKVHADSYKFFSRVGPPIITRHTAIWREQLESPLTIANPHTLPSRFGIFLASTKEEHREMLLKEEPSWLDFHMFEKPKNFATVASPGTVIFTHSMISLKRGGFTKQEMKKHPCTRENWGVWWYVGIQPSGEIKALPCRMNHTQTLPNGYDVHHTGFEIPPAFYEVVGKDKSPHHFVSLAFNAAIAFTASALSGVQVTIRKDKKSARIGLPINALKNYFVDRAPDPTTKRRKPILHYRPAHDRHMADGRIIPVGEHLVGNRVFRWRDEYDVTIGVPGIHYPSPEGLTDPVYIVGDPDAPLPPDVDPTRLTNSTKLGNLMQEIIWQGNQVPIRRGEPTRSFNIDHLPHTPKKEIP